MTREEQIIEKGIEYTLNHNPMCLGGDNFAKQVQALNRNYSFEDGAKWADEHPINVWHFISEMPKAGLILCHDLNEAFEVIYIDEEITSAHWLEFILRSHVQEWLYISDLHPKESRQ